MMKLIRGLCHLTSQILLAASLTFAASLAAAADQIILLTPDKSGALSDSATIRKQGEEYIQRTGAVMFAAKGLLPGDTGTTPPEEPVSDGNRAEGGLAGKVMLVSFFTDKDVAVTVDSESKPGDNILSVRGRQKSAAFSAFTMTITDESYIISFQDAVSGLVYKVVGNSVTGVGKVTEIDPNKLPPVYDSEPIMPPVDR